MSAHEDRRLVSRGSHDSDLHAGGANAHHANTPDAPLEPVTHAHSLDHASVDADYELLDQPHARAHHAGDDHALGGHNQSDPHATQPHDHNLGHEYADDSHAGCGGLPKLGLQTPNST